MPEETKKLTKKELKALEFKKNKPKDVREEQKQQKRKLEEEKKSDEVNEEPKKKRKTRRGKKGKTTGGTRFILFVGNLPYDANEGELAKVFEKSKPDKVRLRHEKGIAFLEFAQDAENIQARMDSALKLHHSSFKGRKINVELTVGGGGNSETRLKKLKEKNAKMLEKDAARAAKKAEKKKKKPQTTSTHETTAVPSEASGVHPSRAALIK